MTQDTVSVLNKKTLRKRTWEFFWRSWFIQASWNYERQMNMGFMYGIAPTLDRIYGKHPKDPETLQKKKEEGGHIASFKEETHALLDRRFHVTVLSLPTLTILTFTILPLIFMILLAFTNASLFYFPPSRRFAWTGLDTFGQLFGGNAGYSFAIGEIFKWTILWAVLATFTNYIGGMILALLINKKGIKFKKIWRTLFIISIAIPQFISLSMMAKFLAKDGPIFNANHVRDIDEYSGGFIRIRAY